MSEDALTSESTWPELAGLDGFWDADATPTVVVVETRIEFDVDLTLDVSVQADLETGTTLGVVSGGLSILHIDDACWTREAGTQDRAAASVTFLARNAAVVELIEDAGVVTITDVFPEAVHRSLDVGDDATIRQLTSPADAATTDAERTPSESTVPPAPDPGGT